MGRGTSPDDRQKKEWRSWIAQCARHGMNYRSKVYRYVHKRCYFLFYFYFHIKMHQNAFSGQVPSGRADNASLDCVDRLSIKGGQGGTGKREKVEGDGREMWGLKFEPPLRNPASANTFKQTYQTVKQFVETRDILPQKQLRCIVRCLGKLNAEFTRNISCHPSIVQVTLRSAEFISRRAK